MKEYTLKDLKLLIDHTNLKPSIDANDIKKLCTEAKDNGFRMVAINSVQTKLCSTLLKGTDVHVGAAISFPLGQTTIETKVFETKNAIKNGADEIDYVVNLTELKMKNYSYVENEMAQIVSACRENGVLCKVIFENCYLTKDEIVTLANIAKNIHPDFIKTSTGFGTSGACLEDVKLMKSVVGEEVKVKAAGGIRTAESFLDMIRAGAERIGTSAGIQIINELKKDFLQSDCETIRL